MCTTALAASSLATYITSSRARILAQRGKPSPQHSELPAFPRDTVGEERHEARAVHHVGPILWALRVADDGDAGKVEGDLSRRRSLMCCGSPYASLNEADDKPGWSRGRLNRFEANQWRQIRPYIEALLAVGPWEEAWRQRAPEARLPAHPAGARSCIRSVRERAAASLNVH